MLNTARVIASQPQWFTAKNDWSQSAAESIPVPDALLDWYTVQWGVKWQAFFLMHILYINILEILCSFQWENVWVQ